MWLMTTGGFVSIVEKASDREAETLTVRARDLVSLRGFCRLAGIEVERAHEEIETDYPFRLVATREEVGVALQWALREVDYPNFKNAAKARRGATYAGFLGRVWTAGLSLTPKSVQDRVDSKWADAERQWSHTGAPAQGHGHGHGHGHG